VAKADQKSIYLKTKTMLLGATCETGVNFSIEILFCRSCSETGRGPDYKLNWTIYVPMYLSIYLSV
jgi:hypothetical protein